MTGFEYAETTKSKIKTILICVLIFMLVVGFMVFALFVVDVGPDPVTVTKAIISMPDGSVQTVNVKKYSKDVRYHTDMITIIDDNGTQWLVDSKNVVLTGNPTK